MSDFLSFVNLSRDPIQTGDVIFGVPFHSADLVQSAFNFSAQLDEGFAGQVRFFLECAFSEAGVPKFLVQPHGFIGRQTQFPFRLCDLRFGAIGPAMKGDDFLSDSPQLLMIQMHRNEEVPQVDFQVVRRVVRVLQPGLKIYYRPRVEGMARIPSGRALLVGVHSGGMMAADALALGAEFYRHFSYERSLQFLAHRILWSVTPGFARFMESIGAVKASPEAGTALLEQDRAVMVYPGGTYEVYRPWKVDEATYWMATADEPWAAGGCEQAGDDRASDDRAAEPVSVRAIRGGGWYAFDITPLVERWLADPTSNHGVVLKGQCETFTYCAFSSADSGVSAYTPYLGLRYLEYTPTPSVTPTATWTPTSFGGDLRSPIPSASLKPFQRADIKLPVPMGTRRNSPPSR